MNKFCALWLEGPFQSWGSESKFGRKMTESFPTKSGILGMYLAALGLRGSQEDFLRKFSDFNLTAIAFARVESSIKGQEPREENAKTLVVRTHPTLMDFHMVGSGYDEHDSWEELMIPRKADGSKAVGGGSKITFRQYLQEMAFGVIHEISSEVLQEYGLIEALKNPVYDVSLGRKNCIPSDFILRGVFENLSEAENCLTDLAKEKNRTEYYRVLDGDHTSSASNDAELRIVSDVPLSFGVFKEYQERYITIIKSNGPWKSSFYQSST